MKKEDAKLVKALKKDYKELYVKEYTTGWREQRLIRNIELGIMSLKNTEEYISQELDRAREEENKRCVDIINRIIQTSGEDSPNQWFDGLRSARESIKLTTK